MGAKKRTTATVTNYYARAAQALYQRLRFVRSLIPPGSGNNLELGGLCEQAVRDLLRSVLPARFGVGYGHVSYGTDLSAGTKPLDVILYDALGYSPVWQEGEFVVVPPPALLAVVEVKATLTAQHFGNALKQIARAFDGLGDRQKPYPGFVLGFAGASEPLWDSNGARVGEQIVGYLEVETDRCRIRRAALWQGHQPNGFAYWYWRLLEELYEGVGIGYRDAPLPEGYEDSDVQFDD